MSTGGPSIEALADSTARVLGLAIALEHRPGVLRYLTLAASYAELLEQVELGPGDESGAIFRPVSPP